jgi:hypothetical protein
MTSSILHVARLRRLNIHAPKSSLPFTTLELGSRELVFKANRSLACHFPREQREEPIEFGDNKKFAADGPIELAANEKQSLSFFDESHSAEKSKYFQGELNAIRQEGCLCHNSRMDSISQHGQMSFSSLVSRDKKFMNICPDSHFSRDPLCVSVLGMPPNGPGAC